MKHALLFLFLLPILSFGQDWQNPMPISEETNKVMYQGVIPVEGITAIELYERAKGWLFRRIKSQKDAVQIDDPRANMIAVKVSYQWIKNKQAMFSQQSIFDLPIKIECKNGRYRVTITDIEYGVNPNGMRPIRWPIEDAYTKNRNRSSLQMIDSVDKDIRMMLDDLQAAMNKPKEDW